MLTKVISSTTIDNNSSTMTNLPNFNFSLPTLFPENCTGMDLPTGFVPVNSSEVRGRTLSTEKNHSRDSLMSSTMSSVVYHERQTINNDTDVNNEPSIESPALSYKTKQENAIRLNKATKNLDNMRPPHGNNEPSLANWNVLATLTKVNNNIEAQLTWTMIIMSSTYNYLTIPMRPLNWNFGAEVSIQYHYMDQLNKSHQIQKASKTRSTLWRDTSQIKR